MEGRTLRVRAPVNYKAEASGTNTPGWLKSKTSTRVFSQEKGKEVSVKPENDKENRAQAQQGKKDSPVSAGKQQADAGSSIACSSAPAYCPNQIIGYVCLIQYCKTPELCKIGCA